MQIPNQSILKANLSGTETDDQTVELKPLFHHPNRNSFINYFSSFLIIKF